MCFTPPDRVFCGETILSGGFLFLKPHLHHYRNA
jgi:hypothetical protein